MSNCPSAVFTSLPSVSIPWESLQLTISAWSYQAECIPVSPLIGGGGADVGLVVPSELHI
jgi:hypothetical protein